MTKTEARRVLEILMTADDGCRYCTSSLLISFVREFPEFEEEADKVWREHEWSGNFKSNYEQD